MNNLDLLTQIEEVLDNRLRIIVDRLATLEMEIEDQMDMPEAP